MDALLIIGMFMTPIVGFGVLDSKYKYSTKDTLINYVLVLVLSNVATNAVHYLSVGTYSYEFSVLFFIKYSLLNMTSSIFIALLIIVMKEKLTTNIKVRTGDKKK